METISLPLSQGKFALIDQQDFERLNTLGKWTYANVGYAYRWDRTKKPNKMFYMHRVVARAEDGQQVDHINMNRLDNRRTNLRVCDRYQNAVHHKRDSYGIEKTSDACGYGGYLTRYKYRGKRIYVGYFKDKLEAMRAYNQSVFKTVSISDLSFVPINKEVM